VNLWGLDAIKTKGESVAIALHLIGARPLREGTGRIARCDDPLKILPPHDKTLHACMLPRRRHTLSSSDVSCFFSFCCAP
jgi:hypothetical protein